jgi:hypothetical protein
MKGKEEKMRVLFPFAIGLQLFTFACLDGNQKAGAKDQYLTAKSIDNAANKESIPIDDYYRKQEESYSYFRSINGNAIKARLDKIPKKSTKSIITANQLKRCFETNNPDLPGIPGSLTRPLLSAGQYSINIDYHTKLDEARMSSTRIFIDIYQNYDQARRLADSRLLMSAQPSLTMPDEKNRKGDYSWNVDQPLNGSSFNINILFSNLHILIQYGEGIQEESGMRYPPIADPKRKEHISQAILKIIQDCQ